MSVRAVKYYQSLIYGTIFYVLRTYYYFSKIMDWNLELDIEINHIEIVFTCKINASAILLFCTFFSYSYPYLFLGKFRIFPGELFLHFIKKWQPVSTEMFIFFLGKFYIFCVEIFLHLWTTPNELQGKKYNDRRV